jgi:hypothetical protein
MWDPQRLTTLWASMVRHRDSFTFLIQGMKQVKVRLLSCLAYCSTLKMEATYSSEASVSFQRTTWHCILEDTTLHFKHYPPHAYLRTSLPLSLPEKVHMHSHFPSSELRAPPYSALTCSK